MGVEGSQPGPAAITAVWGHEPYAGNPYRVLVRLGHGDRAAVGRGAASRHRNIEHVAGSPELPVSHPSRAPARRCVQDSSPGSHARRPRAVSMCKFFEVSHIQHNTFYMVLMQMEL